MRRGTGNKQEDQWASDDVLYRLILGAVASRESSSKLVTDIAERTTAAGRHEGNPAGHSCCC